MHPNSPIPAGLPANISPMPPLRTVPRIRSGRPVPAPSSKPKA